jgi:hypothetical protein
MSWLAMMAAVVVGQAPAAPPLTSVAPPVQVAPVPPTPAAQPASPPPASPAPAAASSDEDGPPASNAQAGVGESQIRASFQMAEATRGALDGRWRLAGADGGALYLFQFSDSGGAPDPRATTPMAPQVEGAWQDLRRPNALNATGMFETVRRDGSRLSIVLDEGDPPRTETITLQPVGSAWSGEFVDGAARTPVTMTRQ